MWKKIMFRTGSVSSHSIQINDLPYLTAYKMYFRLKDVPENVIASNKIKG